MLVSRLEWCWCFGRVVCIGVNWVALTIHFYYEYVFEFVLN